MKILISGLVALGALLALPGRTAESVEAVPATGIDLREALLRAANRNPDLASFAFALRAQDARIELAAQRPALQAGVELEDFAGNGAARGVSGSDLTLTLSSVIELGGQRDRRIDVARREREGLEIARQSAQLDVLAEVARRFIHVAAGQQQLELAGTAVQLAQDTVNEVQRRVRAARSPEVELARARIALSRARVEQEHAEHELLSARRRLAAMWGGREPDFGEVDGDLFRLPQIADFDALARRLAGSPDFLAFASETRQREAEVQLALARARTSLSWSVGVRRLGREHDFGLVAGVSVPLFAGQRAQPQIDAARAGRAEVETRAEAARVRAEATLYGLVQELRHAITEARLLRDEVMPQMQAALAATEYAWQRGRYSYLEWTDAQRERLDVQRALIETAANAQIFQVEIERLTRSAVSGEMP
ncbi:MAG: TolC family protein [Steroidobacteraceae bacterium]